MLWHYSETNGLFSNRVVMLVLFSGKKLFMPKNQAKIRFFHWFVTIPFFYWSTNEITTYWKRNLYIIIATKLVAFDGLISRKNGSYLVAKKQQKQIVKSIQKALFFSLNLIDMVLETYDTPPLPLPSPKKPTNLFIIIKHAFETATKGCCWPFLKATAFNWALFKKPLIVVEWMSLWVKHLHLSPSDWSVTIITNNIDDCKKSCCTNRT